MCFDVFSAEIYWVQLWPWMCFERCLLTCTGFNFGPRCVLNDACWYFLSRTLALSMFQTMSADMYWVQLWPKNVLNDDCWHVLGPTWALHVFWMVAADIYWDSPLALDVFWTMSADRAQLWPKIYFERCLLTCTGSKVGPRCVLNGVCSYLLGATLALHVFWTMLSDMYWVQLWPLDVFWTMSAGMYWVQLGPRCVLIDDCWYALGPTSALGLF